MITVSESAQNHFAELLSKQGDDTNNIRIFVVNPGTPHAECGVSYCPDSSIEETDIEITLTHFSAYIDKDSAPYLDDALIDLQQDNLGKQLTLKAPNAKVKRVADDAPLVERVTYVVESEINPQLASHGGHVKLTQITDDGVAVLQFGGGCQGCGMADVTLKEGIEKTLLESFPNEINAVQDATEHAAGDNPYFKQAEG
jgi:Fe/S biogenesis protein NfuA